MIRSFGFFPQMKAEGIAFKEEKSGAVVIGTNPGFQNGVLVIGESDCDGSIDEDTDGFGINSTKCGEDGWRCFANTNGKGRDRRRTASDLGA